MCDEILHIDTTLGPLANPKEMIVQRISCSNNIMEHSSNFFWYCLISKFFSNVSVVIVHVSKRFCPPMPYCAIQSTVALQPHANAQSTGTTCNFVASPHRCTSMFDLNHLQNPNGCTGSSLMPACLMTNASLLL